MASKSSYLLWKNAIPLCNSWLHFAPDNLRSDFEDIKDPRRWKIQSEHEGLGGRALHLIAQFGIHAQQRDKLERELKAAIESGIMKGDYIAFGFRKAPSRDSKPVQIAIGSSLSIKIDWPLSELSTHECTYDRTCILPSGDMAKLRSQNAPKPAANAILRIRNAITDLASTEGSFRDLTRELQADEVRKHLKIDHVPFDGYSDNNIKKHLIAICGPKRK